MKKLTGLEERRREVLHAFERFAQAVRQETRNDKVRWTTPLQHARARSVYATYALLAAIDTRVGEVMHTTLFAELASRLLATPWLHVPTKVFEGLPERGFHSTAEEFMFDHRWAGSAYPTFEVTTSLAAELLLSDPGKLNEGDIPWPFPAFRVVFPEDFRTPLGVQGDAKACDVRVSMDRVLYGRSSAARLNLPSGSLSGLPYAKDATEFAALLRLILDVAVPALSSASPTPVLAFRVYDEWGQSVYDAQPWQGGDAPIRAWLDNSQPYGVDYDNQCAGPLAADTVAPIVRVAERLVLNLALYLSTRDSRESMGWTPLTRTSNPSHRTWTVGRAVRIGPEVHEAARAVVCGCDARDVRVRHIVRGHFKRAGRLEQRIYVAPYWRGPATGPVVPREYDVR